MKNAALLCRHLNAVLAIASVLLTAKATGQVTAHTRQELFNAGWEFRREGEAGWTAVTLPHDAALDQGYDRTLDPDQGFARAPRTVYRKSFVRPSGEGRFALRFDGVHLESSVSLNGRRVGGFHTGYLPFEVPLENLAPTNTVEVDVSAPQGNARWYQGCGILRDVWLVRRNGWALDPEDAAVTTELNADGSARVKVRVEGAKVVEPANGELLVREPRLWTPETPHLEEIEVVAENAAGERDSLRVRYGIRTVEFTADRGLLLNGKPYRIKGICQHETFGALGAAFSAAATKREMRALKDLGVNAIRTVHNPFSPRFYDLCDELGFLVKNEAFDEWRVKHTANGYYRFFDACWTNDLRRLVRRDRNHPSVVIWSIGNEIPDHWESADAGALARAMVEEVHALDPSRPVTAGLCRPGPASTNGVMAALDVVGLNYNAGWFAELRGKRPVFGSETAPSLAERDTYLYEERDGRMTPVQSVGHRECAYSPKAFGWAAPAETALRVQIDSPWSAGEFAWCTYDYLGEPNHTGRNRPDYWPARSSYWGLCDLAGFPKDRYYLYRSQWNEASPTVHLMPDWTWPGKEGRVFPVWCYTNAREAELFLNGRSQGVRRFADTKDLHLSWDVAYEPGVLEVRAKMADGTVVTDRKVTAGPAVRYRVTKDFAADGLVFFRVDAVDRDGNRVSACEDEVRVKVSSGTLVATDNGDATDHTPFASPVRRLFRGSLLVIVREAVAGDPTLEVSVASVGRGFRGPDFSVGVSVVEDRPGIQDSGNANAVALGDGRHAVAYYSGQEPDTAVYVLRGASN